MTKLQHRLSRQEGFTLIELLIVIVIIGILLAIAVPSYLGFKDRANKRATQSNLRAAVPTAEAFYSDNGTYNGLNHTTMVAIDSGRRRTSRSLPAAAVVLPHRQRRRSDLGRPRPRRQVVQGGGLHGTAVSVNA